MDEKKFTLRQLCTMIFIIVAGFAFLNTGGGPIWSSAFLKEFAYNLFTYAMIAAFIMVVFNSVLGKD